MQIERGEQAGNDRLEMLNDVVINVPQSDDADADFDVTEGGATDPLAVAPASDEARLQEVSGLRTEETSGVDSATASGTVPIATTAARAQCGTPPPRLPAEAWAQREAIKRNLSEAERMVSLKGSVSQARDLLLDARRRIDSLLERFPNTSALVRDSVRAATQLSEVSIRLGQSKPAMQAMQLAVDRLRQLHDLPIDDVTTERFTALSYDKVGELALRLGDGESARRLFKQARKLHRQRAIANPQNPETVRDLSASNIRLGDLCARMGKFEAARDYFLHSLELRQSLTAALPNDPLYRRDLTVSLSKLGDVHSRLGDNAAAHDCFRRALAIHQQLAADEPDRAQGQRDLAVSYNKVGNLALKCDQFDEARNCFQQWLAIAESLAAADTTAMQAQGELAYCLGCLGRLEMRVGDFETARLWLGRGVTILEVLERQGRLEGLPNYQAWLTEQRQQLATCQDDGWTVDGLDLSRGDASATSISISRLLVEAGDAAVGADATPMSTPIAPPPATDAPPSQSGPQTHFVPVSPSEWIRAEPMDELPAELDQTAEPLSDAAEITQAVRTPCTMVAVGASDVADLLATSSTCLAGPDFLAKATVDLNFVLGQSPRMAAQLLVHRARCLAACGRLDRMEESIERFQELTPIVPAHLFALAGACAAAVAWLEDQPGPRTPDDLRDLRYWNERAVRYLREAIAIGFGELDRLARDPAWRVVRHHPSVAPLWQTARSGV